MTLMQFLAKDKVSPIKLRDDMIPAYPWNGMVSRVIKHELDPFITENYVETVHDVKQNIKEYRYEDLMNQRAIELLAIDKPMYIMWSGGIDSTSVLVSILMNATPQQLEKVYVVCTTDSVREYPEFWLDISKIFKGRIKSSHVHPAEFCKLGIVVTGEHADQLFGSDVILAINYHFGFDAILAPWEDVMPKLYEKLFGPNNLAERYKPTISHSLYPIKTAFDWCWWYNFSNKWSQVRFAMLSMDGWGEHPADVFYNVHRFFDTIPFQQWSMQSPHLKIKNDMPSYKFLAKEYIVAYTKHESYLNKRKEPSLGKLWKVKKPRYGITPQLEYLTLEQIKEYVNK